MQKLQHGVDENTFLVILISSMNNHKDRLSMLRKILRNLSPFMIEENANETVSNFDEMSSNREKVMVTLICVNLCP